MAPISHAIMLTKLGDHAHSHISKTNNKVMFQDWGPNQLILPSKLKSVHSLTHVHVQWPIYPDPPVYLTRVWYCTLTHTLLFHCYSLCTPPTHLHYWHITMATCNHFPMPTTCTARTYTCQTSLLLVWNRSDRSNENNRGIQLDMKYKLSDMIHTN